MTVEAAHLQTATDCAGICDFLELCLDSRKSFRKHPQLLLCKSTEKLQAAIYGTSLASDRTVIQESLPSAGNNLEIGASNGADSSRPGEVALSARLTCEKPSTINDKASSVRKDDLPASPRIFQPAQILGKQATPRDQKTWTKLPSKAAGSCLTQ